MTQRNVVCKTTLVWIALAALLLSPTRVGAARLVASLPAGRFFLTPQSAQEKEQERREREQEAREREEEKREREQEAKEREQEKIERLEELYDDGREALDDARVIGDTDAEEAEAGRNRRCIRRGDREGAGARVEDDAVNQRGP